MPPKSRNKPLPESTAPDPHDTSTRAIYGDNRAATEDAMMLAHAQHLRSAGIISNEMATQLSQPWHKTGELKIKYTKEYLAMHPAYTGENADRIPSFEWAQRKQREKDRAEEKWMRDFEAGKIDEEGRVVEGSESSRDGESSGSGDGGDGRDGDDSDDEAAWEDTGEEDDDDDDEDGKTEGRPAVERTSKTHMEAGSKKSDEMSNIAALATERSQLPITAHSSSTPNSSASLNLSQTGADEKKPTTPAASAAKRYRPPITPSPTPLSPLPGFPTYTDKNYFALAALCRERNLPGFGNVLVVRNRLIQDDINVAQGKERAVRSRKGKSGTSGRVRDAVGGDSTKRKSGTGLVVGVEAKKASIQEVM